MDDNDLSPITLAIICIVSATTMLITCHCLLIFLRCNQQEPSSTTGMVTNHRSINNTATNITEYSKEELMKSFKYDEDVKSSSRMQDKTCCICLAEYEKGEEVRVLPECLHSFHALCIGKWLQSHSNCPLCRMCMGNSEFLLAQRPTGVV